MNEATGDFLSVVTEMYRDVVDSGQPVAAIDQLLLLPAYLDLGESYGLAPRNVLDPFYYEWFDGIGDEEQHAAGGPIGRMLVLLSYGCARFDSQTGPLVPRNCRLLPQGFRGIGPITAVRLWAKAVTQFSESPDFVEARLMVLFAAFLNDGVFGGSQQRAAADAFAAINVGLPAAGRSPDLYDRDRIHVQHAHPPRGADPRTQAHRAARVGPLGKPGDSLVGGGL